MINQHWKTILLIILAISSAIDGKGQKGSGEPSSRPNILFIMSDDHAVNAIGTYKKRLSQYTHTPNINQLAAEGMRFDQCFATNSICSPSRATILTGKYSHKNGVYILNQTFTSQPTSASILRQAGYRTAVFGKWHLKSVPEGFDEYKVLKEQGRYENPEFLETGSETMIEHKGWVDDIITSMTTDFIEDHPKDVPFFVMCHYKSVHDPWLSRPPYDTAYQQVHIPEPDNLCDDYLNCSEAARRTTLKLDMIDQRTFSHERLNSEDTCQQRKFIYQQYIKAYLRSARVMDENVGKLMAFLKEQKLDKNTIVIYTADQGHFLGEHGFFSKRFMYDESIQMPLIVRYPEKIKSGSVCNELITNVDFAPTILNLAGEVPPKEMQGKSFTKLLWGQEVKEWQTAIYYRYWQHLLHRDVAAHYGVRTKQYKLIFYYGLALGQTDYAPTKPEWEFFDLTQDPAEMHNRYNDPNYTATVANLKQTLVKLKQLYDDTDNQYPELQSMYDIHFADKKAK